MCVFFSIGFGPMCTRKKAGERQNEPVPREESRGSPSFCGIPQRSNRVTFSTWSMDDGENVAAPPSHRRGAVPRGRRRLSPCSVDVDFIFFLCSSYRSSHDLCFSHAAAPQLPLVIDRLTTQNNLHHLVDTVFWRKRTCNIQSITSIDDRSSANGFEDFFAHSLILID